MATQDDFVKTALRLPRALHADIQSAALAGGRSMNAEIISRLQATVDAPAGLALLERLQASENALLETVRKQRDQLMGVVERFQVVAEGADAVLAVAKPTQEILEVRRNIEVLRAVIATINGYR
jgi:hypothetical protein